MFSCSDFFKKIVENFSYKKYGMFYHQSHNIWPFFSEILKNITFHIMHIIFILHKRYTQQTSNFKSPSEKYPHLLKKKTIDKPSRGYYSLCPLRTFFHDTEEPRQTKKMTWTRRRATKVDRQPTFVHFYAMNQINEGSGEPSFAP